MKAYVITTGTIFGLLVLVHVWRAVEEGRHLWTSPSFDTITVAAAALSVWAWRLVRRASRS